MSSKSLKEIKVCLCSVRQCELSGHWEEGIIAGILAWDGDIVRVSWCDAWDVEVKVARIPGLAGYEVYLCVLCLIVDELLAHVCLKTDMVKGCRLDPDTTNVEVLRAIELRVGWISISGPLVEQEHVQASSLCEGQSFAVAGKRDNVGGNCRRYIC